MKKSRFTEEQIVFALKQAELGTPVPEVCRKLVLSPDAVREWLSPETTPSRAEEIAHDAALPEKAFTWHPVSRKVGNIHHQGRELIEPVQEGQD